jgi:Single-strand binding protein family
MPDPQPQAGPRTNPAPEPSTLGSFVHGRLGWLHRLPLALSRHATVSTVPRVQGQGRPPGQTIPGGQDHDRGSRQLRRQPHRPPELRHTEGGIARARFRVAVSGRREHEPSFFTVIAWRDQAKHGAESLHRGSRVVVVGRLQHRTWTAEEGGARAVVEVVAEELGQPAGGRRRHRAGWPGRLEKYVIFSRHRPCTPVDRERD